MIMKQLFAIALSSSLIISLLNHPATACSRILFNTNNDHVVGRTMDLYMPDHPNVVVYPRGIPGMGPLPTVT